MEKIKQFIENILQSKEGNDILVVIIVILVGLGSFELGRLSTSNTQQGIKINYNQITLTQVNPNTLDKNNTLNQNSIKINNTDNANKSFFASKKGKKYYSLGCSAGKTIKESNRIYFKTSDEAEKMGYTLSSSCSY